MNYTGPKVKLSRKLGIRMTPKASRVMEKKYAPPGQHGKRRKKLSDYANQLLAKQKLRLQYNVSEKQMSNYYKKATKLTGNTAELLVQLLETRLDSVIKRSGFAKTIYAARQYVQHGHITINGKKVDIPSYQVKLTDEVAIKEKSRNMECIQESIRNFSSPEYIDVNKSKFAAKFNHIPTRDEVPILCEVSLVVEYYSR